MTTTTDAQVAHMWEPTAPTDDSIRQGDLLDYRTASDITSPISELPISPATLVSDGKHTSVSTLPTRKTRAIVVSQCCPNDNDLRGKRYISVALVVKVTLDTKRIEQYRDSLRNEIPEFVAGQPVNYNIREFALDCFPPRLPELPDNKIWIVNLTHQTTFTGEIERLLPYRDARMTVICRDHLRYKLMWLLGRPEEADIASLSRLGIKAAAP